MNFKFRHIIYPVYTDCRMVLEPVFPVTVTADATYEAEIYPYAGLKRYGLRNTENAPTDADREFFAAKHTFEVKNGCLEMDVRFPQEDCYIFRLYVNGKFTESVEVYALNDDIYNLNPYKGDNHMHTWMSDGKDSPMYMAATACRKGFDYCVITDHNRYEPSLIARDFYKDTGVDFLVIPGEEVHSPDNPVHIINLGGDESVNDWWRDHEDEYRASVDAEIQNMTEPMFDGTRYAAAASQVMFERIRNANGVAVLCHPHWMIWNGYNEAEDVTDYLFDHRKFDALELIAGGAYEDGTQLQISYYKEKAKMPVLGSSDSHSVFGTRLAPGNFTIVFAEALSAEGVKNAIRAAHTVAGNENKLYGDYRLVKYAYFLQRNFYGEHAAMRQQLGNRMLRFASSRDEATDDIRQALVQPRPSEVFAGLRY